MTCPQCGYLYAPLETECPRCEAGYKPAGQQETEKSHRVPTSVISVAQYCPRCQAPLPPGQAVCPLCDDPPSSGKTKDKPAPKRPWFHRL